MKHRGWADRHPELRFALDKRLGCMDGEQYARCAQHQQAFRDILRDDQNK